MTQEATQEQDALQKLKTNPLLESYQTILEFFYGKVELSTLEKMAFKSLDLFDEDEVKEISKRLSLKTNIQTIDPKKLQNHHFPCIAIDENLHAIVLFEKKGEIFEISQGYYSKRQKASLKAVKRFNKIITFEKNKEINKTLKVKDKNSKSWFYKVVFKEYKSFLEVGFISIFINLFGLAFPLYSRIVYNSIVPNFAIDSLYVLTFGVAIVLVFDTILKAYRVSILEKASIRISHHLEEELFRKILTVHKEYDRYMVGTKVNLFRELSAVKDFFANKIPQLMDLPFFFLAISVIFIINHNMAIVPVVGATLALGFNFIMQYPIAKLHKKSFEETQSRQGYLVEQIQGDEAIRLANALPQRLFKWTRVLNYYHNIQKNMAMLNGISAFISQNLVQAISIATIIAGIFCIHNGTLSVGGLIAITMLSGRAMVPVMQFSNLILRYKQIKESLESLSKYWNLPTEEEKHIEVGVGKAKGRIEFENVSFVHPNKKAKTIDNISFLINPGERVGIVGQTGAGKTTIQKLLTGIYHPSEGRVYLDNQDISLLHPVELRTNISLMPQEPYLFSGTLKENIELSHVISKQEMTQLLEKTGLMDLVKRSSDSHSLDVGERGENLSVGQRHLVGLARALLNKSPILILDEPTTGLDVGLEKRLVEHLNSSIDKKTLIVITHRFAALELVDRVILIDKGKIIADGKKEDVLKLLSSKR